MDTCFSGATVAFAYKEGSFTLSDEENFYILASGTPESEVPDTSDFFIDLITELTESNKIENFLYLSGKLKTREAPREHAKTIKSRVTPFFKDVKPKFKFFLEREDPVAPILKNSFLDLPSSLQPNKVTPFVPRPINLIYMNGTEKCGHHLFAKVLFNKIKKGQVDLSYFLKSKFVLGPHEAGNPEKQIWQWLSSLYFGNPDVPSASVANEIVKELYSEGHRIVVFRLQKDLNTIDDSLLKAWQEIYQTFDLEKKGELKGGLFILIFDERGCLIEDGGEEKAWKNRMALETFNNMQDKTLAFVLELDPLRPLAKDNYDLWSYSTGEDLKSENLPVDELKNIKFDTDIPIQERYLELAIHKICELFGNRTDVFEDLFSPNKLPENTGATPQN